MDALSPLAVRAPDQDLAAALAHADRLEPARPPATVGEIWSREWDRAALDTAFGIADLRRNVTDEGVKAVEAASGKSIAQLAAERGRTLDGPALDVRKWIVQDVAQSADEATKTTLQPYADLDALMRRRAARIESDAQRAADAAYGLSGWAVGVAAGMARQAVDPINLAAMAIPGAGEAKLAFGAARGAAGFVAREAGAAALGQAAQEPFVELGREALGLDHGFGRAMANIGGAAAVGGAFGLGRLGLAALFDRAGAMLHAAPKAADGLPVDPTMRPLAESFDAADLHAAARAAERDAVFHAPPDIQPERLPAHGDALEAAARGMEAGEPIAAPRVAEAGARVDAPARVVTATGRELDVRNVVMEWRDLQISHDATGARNPEFPQELQPRERDRAASRAWIDERAGALVPEWLGPTAQIDAGAPLIGPDRVVESGNGRALLIGRAYERHPDRAQAYRDFLARSGFDVSGMNRPVLVRERLTDLSPQERVALTLEGNKSQTMRFSDAEQAAADAGALTSVVMAKWRGGSLASGQNAAFARGFIERVTTPEERGALIDASGHLSAAGQRRMEAAMVAKGWESQDITRALFEDPNPTSRAIIGAMADAAPAAARLRAAVAEGRIPASADPTRAMVDALKLVERARGEGQKVRDMLDQVDLEHGAVPEDVRAAARMYFNDDLFVKAAGRDRVLERIETAISDAHKAALGPDMFGYTPTAAAVLDKASREGTLLDELPLASQEIPSRKPDRLRADAAPAPVEPASRQTATWRRPADLPDLAAQRADAERGLRERPDLGPIEIAAPDGSVERVAAADLLARADRLKTASAELADCIAGVAE